MATRRLSFRQIKEVLRLCQERGFPSRDIRRSLGSGRSVLCDYLNRAPQGRSDEAFFARFERSPVERHLFPAKFPVASENRQMLRIAPNGVSGITGIAKRRIETWKEP